LTWEKSDKGKKKPKFGWRGNAKTTIRTHPKKGDDEKNKKRLI